MPAPASSPPSTSRRRTVAPSSCACFEGTRMTEPAPTPRLTVVTLGVRDFHASLRFYEALGFVRKVRSTGDEVAFLDAGGLVLALYRWNQLAQDAVLAETPVPAGFRGITLA